MKKLLAFLKYFFTDPRQFSLTNLVIVFTLLAVLQASVLSLHKVVSESMEDTLLVGDTLLLFRTWYGFRPPFFNHAVTPGFKPQPDDIVICIYPGDPKQEYVKRIAAIGGDTVAIDRKHLFVNGNPVPPPQTAKFADPEILRKENARRDFYPLKVVERDSLFVLGDNRDFSFDSRSWGPLPSKNLRGKVGYILFSLDPKVPWSDFRHKLRKGRFFIPVK
ncbi:signal peptidase I [bacterium]|nr:signal peptidase I [bacterium]